MVLKISEEIFRCKTGGFFFTFRVLVFTTELHQLLMILVLRLESFYLALYN